MKFSEHWLREHVTIDATRDELAERLTAIGLEVEGITVLGEALDRIVVAQIISAEPHPKADRLRVCAVDAGLPEPLQIVCGAPNARAGLRAPLALVGANVGEITIKAAELRGMASNGMLCSSKELGFDEDASGLMELPEDAPIGTPLAAYLGLPDASIELKLTPNRADCFSVRGIAFDVAAAFGSRVKPLSAEPVPATSPAQFEVNLHAGAAAPRYLGRVIEDVDASRPTPVWMAERLRRSGVRPVSLLVDITQYVMLELGQPMHAFDHDFMTGLIGVRHARAGETLTLLDGRNVTLDPDFLVVTDLDIPVALAGLMGELDTRVTEETENVFLESAHFAPSAIIGRSRRLGLSTDAAHRFERGVDPELPRLAIEYATRLILETAGGRPGPVTEAVLPEHLPAPRAIPLRRARLARVLGLTIADAEVERILSALGLDVAASAEGWHVTAPPRRFDLTIEEDLIEEIARIHGYDAIPTTLPGGGTRLAAPSETQVSQNELRQHLTAREYLEAINYAFVDAAWLGAWSMDAGTVPLANPLSAELAVMRPSLLPGLTDALKRNLARQQARVRLFEIGRTFAAAPDGGAPVETIRIAAVIAGTAVAEQWGAPARAIDFHDLKGDLASLAACAGAALDYQPSTQPHGHPGRSATITRAGAAIGWIGELHPRLTRALDIDMPVLAFELDLPALQARALPRVTALSRFPQVRRDLAIVVDDSVPWSALETTIRSAAGPALVEVRLFDRYLGKGIEPGRKSLAMGLILQDKTRTLTDTEVEAQLAAVVAALGQAHGASLRQ